MKLFKTLMIGLLAMTFVASANAAALKIYIVGSTAYRSSVHTAIINQLNAGGAYTFAYSSSSGASGIGAAPGSAAAGSGASQQIYSGTIAGKAVIIKTNWTGSAGGIQQVTQPVTTNFMNDSALTGATSSGVVVTGVVNDPETPTVAMSDVFQSSTPFNSIPLNVAGTVSQFVGVIPFVFVVNADWPGGNASFNVTPQTARALWGGSGATPLSLFTGNSVHSGTSVYAVGRDPDSGTRLTAFAETGIGAAATVTQIQPFFGGQVTSIATGTGASAGTGYTSAPTVQVVGSGGLGYGSVPTVTTVGGGGTATLTAVLSNGSVTSVTVNSSSGFTSNPTLSFSGGSPTVAATAGNFTPFVDTSVGSPNQGQIRQIFVSNPGSGATAHATISSGTLASVVVDTAGSGYQGAPTVNLIGGGFTTAGSASAKVGNYTCSGLDFWPAETVNGIPLVQGNGGYASGGSLSVALGSTGVTSFGGYLLGYLGTSDAAGATGLQTDGSFVGSGLGAKVCSYNGVVYSKAAIQQGQYTFWGYEHMYYSTLDSNGIAVVNAIADQIANTDALITLPSMLVSRPTDGGIVTHN